MEYYKKWVRRNKDYVRSVDSLASGLTLLLPENLLGSELGSEAVSTLVSILAAVNEHIIDTAPSQTEKELVEYPSYSWASCTSALKELETLVEVAAEHFYGENKKWNFIAITEAAKVLFRLALFRESGYKMLLDGGETPNAKDSPKDLSSQPEMGGLVRPGAHYGPEHFYGNGMHNIEGRALSALSRFGENANIVSCSSSVTRFQNRTAEILDPPTSKIKRPTLSAIWPEKGLCSGVFLMAEVLHITRPLIYVLLIRKYGVRSWIPWLLSLGVDLTGTSLLFLAKHPFLSQEKGHPPFSTLEKNEIRKRKVLWAFYLMRDPFFSIYTRGKFEKAEQILEPVPIIGFLTAKLIELVIGAQTRYTYMSAS